VWGERREPLLAAMAHTLCESGCFAGIAPTRARCPATSVSHGGYIPSDLISVLWGLVAAGLLVAGFVWRCRHWRYSGIVTFGFAVVRLVLVDMADSSMNARILGCLVIGVLMVSSAFLYGYLSRTYLSSETR